jgi:lysozyme
MRSPLVFGSLAALLALAGCNSTASIDDMGIPRPSLETTSSIARLPKPVPAGMVSPVDVAAPAAVRRQPMQTAAVMRAPEPVVEPAPEIEPVPLVEEKPIVQAAAFQMGRIHGPKFRDADPVSFGSLSPKKYAVHGVDVSRWQGNINWSKLQAQGANFAYIKATDGGDHVDPMFRKNWNDAGKAGLRRGAYHFFYWCRTGSEQADWFIRNVPKVANALPPVIDVEYNHGSKCKRKPSRDTVLKKMKGFMDKLEAHYGQRPIIYTAPDFYEDNLQGEFGEYAFWLRSTAAHPRSTYPDRKWVFWQYSGTGLSHGVRGEIDLNVFNGSQETWNRWLAKTAG